MLSLFARRTFAAYGLLLAVYVLSPPVAPALPITDDEALAYGFGVRLSHVVPDATPWLTVMSGAEICYIDEDGVGTYSPGEAVFMRAQGGCTSANAGAGALRLAALGDLKAGERILGGDPDGGTPARSFTPDPSKFKYIDLNGDSRVSSGDAVYADTRLLTSNRVDVGDVRITPFDGSPGGVHVASGDDDVGRTLSLVGEMGQVAMYVDADGTNSFTEDDYVVLRTAPDSSAGIAQVGDLRLGGIYPELFGSWYELGDPDAPARLTKMANAGACLVGDDDYQEGDTVVVRNGSCTGDALPGDQRLASSANHGERIAAGDAEEGDELHALSGQLTYRDLDGTSGFGAEDALYLNVLGSATKIDVGDIRLSGDGDLVAGAAVSEEDDDEGRSTVLLGDLDDHLGFADAGRDGAFGAGDLLYLNRDAGWSNNVEDVEVGDVRLGDGPGDLFFGSAATTGSPEVVRRLTYRTFAACIQDADGDNAHDPDEGAYLNPDGCGGGVALNAIRLVAGGGDPAGSRVGSADEVGVTLTAPSSQLAYLDGDGSASWTEDDTLYVHFASPLQSVRVGDLRLTPYGEISGGTSVASGDQDHNQPLAVLSNSISGGTAYLDADGSGSYTAGDPLYLAPVSSSATSATLGFVRVSTLDEPAARAAPAPDDDADDDVPPADDIDDDLDDAEDDADDLAEDLADDDGDGYANGVERERGTDPDDAEDYPGRAKDSKRQPGFGGAALLAAALGALWVRRRRGQG